MNRPSRFLWIATLVMFGCSTPAEHLTNAAAATLDSGWTQASDPKDGIAIGVPPGWREGADTTLDPLGMAQSAASDASNQGSVDPNNPVSNLQAEMSAQSKQAEQEELARLRSEGTVLQIIDSSKPIVGEARTRYYVKLTTHNGNYSLDAATADEQEHLKGLGSSPPQMVDLPVGKAAKFEADAKTIGGDEVTRISYVLVDGKNSYVLRFISTNNSQAIQSIADPVAHSLRIKPGA